MRSALAIGIGVALALALGALGCEKTTHQSIDRWRATVQGPAKLAGALGDGSLDADLRAHAAQALVSLGRTDEVERALARLPEGERQAIVARLVPRLWSDCKLTDELARPTEKQLHAKDALFTLRPLAAPGDRDVIDGYLLDWLTGYYEGRAVLGLHRGEKIVRTLGAKAAPKLIAAARAILDDPGTEKEVPVLGDELLKGIAYAGAPAAVGFLLDVAEQQHVDESLKVRAVGALYLAYVTEPAWDRGPPAELLPHLPRLQAMGASLSQPGENVNVAFELIAAARAPDCLGPLAALAGHADEVRRWRAVRYGLECAGADAIVPLAEALPQDAGYQQGIIEKYFWARATALGEGVKVPARTLLASRNWVAKLTGIELLAAAGDPADAARLRALGGDKARARGWWGKDPKERRKPEPTLGERAVAAANRLEKKP